MLLARPDQTPYDLRWKMFGIPIRVHPFFWVLSALLGWNLLQALGFTYLLIWIACVFVSVLLHELGHVWMGQVFGARGEIVLYSFGGLAIGSSDLRNRWQRIGVYAAGPGIQLVLYGVLRLVLELGPPGTSPHLAFALLFLLWINLYWPLLNLLPVFPLDGGQITRDFFGTFSRRGTHVALQISVALCVLIAIYGVLIERVPDRVPNWLGVDGYFLAIMFVLLLVSNVQMLQAESERQRWIDERAPWDDPNW